MDIFLPELIGTMLLIIFGDGVVANVVLGKTKGQNSGWIVIATGWGMAVFVGAFTVIYYKSGALLNPALTIGLLTAGKIPFDLAVTAIIGQFIGAFIGAVIVFLAYYQHFGATEDKGLKLAVFCTGPAIRNTGWNLITEIIGTFTLVFGILTFAATTKGVPPVGVAATAGFLVWAIGLSLGGPTGYAINPARDLAPRIAHAVLPIPGKGDSDWGYSWIPVVGPVIGGIIAALIYSWTLGQLPPPTS
jgi:glycerol uptake facilitator protein